MLKKMLLLTAATVAVYASDARKVPDEDFAATTRVAASPTTDVSAIIDVQMQQFRTSVLNTVSELQEEKATLESNLREVQADKQRFFQQLQEAQQREQTVREELAKAQSEHAEALAKAQSSMDSAVKDAVASKAAELESLQSEFDSVITQRDAASERLSASERSLAELQSAAAANSTAMAALRQELDTANASAKIATEHNTHLSATLAATQEEITTKAGILANTEQKLAAQEAAAESLQRQLRDAKAEGSATSELATQLQQQLTGAQQTIASASLEHSKISQQLDALRAERESQVRELTGQLEAVKGEHKAFLEADKDFVRFKKAFNESGPVPGMIRGMQRSGSQIWRDAVELPDVRDELTETKKRGAEQESEFGQRMAAMSQEIEQLKATIAGNAAALAELDDLRQAARATDVAHQQAIQTLTLDYEDRIDALNCSNGLLSKRVDLLEGYKLDLERRVADFAQTIQRMETLAGDNASMIAQLREEKQRLEAEKINSSQKEAEGAKALALVAQEQQQELAQKQLSRAATLKAAQEAAAKERADAVAGKTISVVEIKRMLETVDVAGIPISSADRALLEAKNTKTYTKDAAGDKQRASDDRELLTSKQIPAKNLVAALRSKAAELRVDGYQEMDTAGLTGAIQTALSRAVPTRK